MGCDRQNEPVRVQDSGGNEWSVRRLWVPRYEGKGLRSRVQARRDRRRGKRAARRSRDNHWYDALDILDVPLLDLLDDLFVIVAVIAAVVFVVVFGIPLLLAVFDTLFVIVVAAVGFISRVLFRRPWTVLVTSPSGETRSENVVGWRESGLRVKELASRARAGRLT